MSAVINYFREAWIELGKISWPTREQTIKLTIAVMIFSVVLAAFIASFDFGLSTLVKKVLIK